MQRKTKSLLWYIMGFYLVSHISSIIFLNVFPQKPMDFVCWILILVGTLLFCMHLVGKENTIRIFSWNTQNGFLAKVMKILLYCQLFSIPLFIGYLLVPSLQNIGIISDLCMLLHIPEVFLLNQTGDLLWMVGEYVLPSQAYLLFDMISIYAFQSVIVFLEFYICLYCMEQKPYHTKISAIKA